MKNILVILLVIILSACNQHEQKKVVLPIDKIDRQNEEKEFIDIFLKDDEINTKNKSGEARLSFLLFGADGCSACSAMKKSLTEQGEISSVIKENYLPYYINISKKNSWNINNRTVTLAELKEKFFIRGTPTTVIMYGDNILLIYPGYIAKNRIYGTLQFFLDERLYLLDKNEISDRLREYYKEKNI